ncbi:MAG: TetR/AcrR family transcriptional regulator [Deltaproteobacteria bacterium]|nr:TetR/AcrR family transcriptional regulator [Deltaproteobacteria bacterium]
MREAVSEAILDAAEQVALENGIEAATAAAIAQRAGVAVGTLYNYFPDRDGILAALFKTRRAAIVPALDVAADETKALPFEERLRAYVRRLLEVFDDNASFLRLAVRADGEGASIKGRDKTLMTQVLHHISQIMREGASRKLFPLTRVEPYARMLQGSLKGMVLWRVEEGVSVADDADLVVDTFLRGVSTTSPGKPHGVGA